MQQEAPQTPHARQSFQDGVQVYWDATSLTAAHKCPRYYYYRILCERAPVGESVHLIFGRIFASALESVHKAQAEGQPLADALLRAVRTALTEAWPVRNILDANPKKHRVNLIRAIVWYFDEETENILDYRTHILPDGRPAAELSFKLQVTDNFYLCGHLDRIIEIPHYGVFIVDQKTTGGSLSDYFFAQFAYPNVQMTAYAAAGQIAFNSPVRGVIIEGVQLLANEVRFKRSFTHRTPAQINEWLDETARFVEQMQETTRRGDFPMRPTACNDYGGCPFRAICSADPSVREHMEADLAHAPWDPAKAR